MPPRLTPLYISAFFALAAAAMPGGSLPPTWAQVPTRSQVDEAQDTQLPEDPAAIIAVVNRSPILLGELTPKVDAKIRDVLSQSSQNIPANQLHFARVNLIRGLLSQAIQNKMMRESFLIDQVGTESAEKRDEADAKLATRARQMFFETELPELQKQYKVTDRTELNEELLKKGSSLAGRQRDFVDAMLGHLYIRSKVDRDPVVSIAEINEYYKANIKEFEHPAKSRWEQITVLLKNFDSREAAHREIWEMGREAYYGGDNMKSVARNKSQEPYAKQGGLHDWTSQGSLVSDELDEQVFTIPLEKMSDIIEDKDGFHIIRVLQREAAGWTPLSEVQDDIRATIRKDKIAKAQQEVMKEMKDRIPVWSLFPDDTPGAKPLPDSIANRANSEPIR
jgi:hypothetical protein